MKQDYNEFAGRVQLAVNAALENQAVADTAQMYAGTLFVTCNAYSAAKIETKLREQLCCGVIVSKVGPEYAFDFV